MLLDVAGNVWMIDFATTGPGHTLIDLARLIVSCLVHCVSADAVDTGEERVAFEAVCRTIAAAPGTGFDYPKTKGCPPHMKHLDDVLALLWP